MRRATAGMGAFLVLWALSACSARPPAADRDAALRGGTLKVGMFRFGEADYDPGVAHQAQVDFELSSCCLVRTLLSYNGKPTNEGGAELRPDLAQALPDVSADGLIWTFKLRPGLRYAPPLEDVPIVAADIARAIERSVWPRPEAAELGAPVGGGFFATYFQHVIAGIDDFTARRSSSIRGIEVPDARTIRFRLTEPTGDFAYRVAFPLAGPVPANPSNPIARFGVAEGHPEDYGWHLVASGPYMLEGAESLDFAQPPEQQKRAAGVTKDRVVLVRNPSWQRSQDSLRPAYPDRIEFVTPKAENDDDLFDEVARGDLDLVFDFELGGDRLGRALSKPEIRRQLFVADGNTLRFAGMSVAVPPFDDVNVRRAMNEIVDKPALLSLYSTGPKPGRVATHIGLDAHESNLLVSYDPFKTLRGPNVEGAHADMAKSRYDSDKDGRCDADACKKIRAFIRVDDDFSWQPIARTLAQQVAGIGIDLKLEPVDGRTFFDTVIDPANHLPVWIAAGWAQDFPNASTFMPALFGGTGIADGPGATLLGATPEELRGWQYSVTSVASVDDRIRQCTALTFGDQSRCWAELDVYLMEQVAPMIPLFVEQTARVVSLRVRSFSFDQDVAMPALDRISIRAAAS